MISLREKFYKEYDNVKDFYFQEVPANTIFPISDQSPISFEVKTRTFSTFSGGLKFIYFLQIPGIPGVFIDPQRIYINLEVNLLKQKTDGSYEKIGEEGVALEQAPLYSIFKVSVYT